MKRLVTALVVALAGTLLTPTAAPATHPVEYRCVMGEDGTVRQTLDPLSPDCRVWDGHDNGGATWQGVTGDEIRIVLYNNFALEGDMSGPYEQGEDRATPASFDQYNIRRTIKAHLRHFQQRFETYGRTVRMIAQDDTLNAPCAQQVGAAHQALEMEPFAVIFFGNNATCYLRVMAGAGVPAFGLNQDVPAALYADLAPRVWSFVPDMETQVGLSAGFICRSLLGAPARFSPDPTLRSAPRRLALMFGRGASSHLDEEAGILQEQLEERCGYEFPLVRSYAGAGESAAAGAEDAVGFMAEAKLAGVTTMVCYCVPVEQSVTAMQAAATAHGYFPEWYWDNASYMDRGIWQQVFGNPLHASFGVTYRWRQPAFEDQWHHRAFREQEPSGAPNARHSWTSYHLLMHLFAAVQLSGETLTPENAADGLRTWVRRDADDPFTPVGGHDLVGPSPQTFIDSAMAWWWDPTGTPPGAPAPEGCLRVAEEGRRHGANDWPAGDAHLYDPTAPCSEDGHKLYDAEGDLGRR